MLPLLRRGIATMPTVRDVDKAIRELSQRLTDPDLALIVNGNGFVIAENNRSAFTDSCVVIHWYSEDIGGRKLIQELEQFCLDGGMTRITGYDINNSKAFARLVLRKGWEATQLGTTYEFNKRH